MPDTELIEQVTRGFAGLRDETRRRDETEAKLSERVGLIEYRLGEQHRILEVIQTDMAKAETVQIKMRVDALETSQKESKDKQKENARLIKGLIISVILLLLGVLFNFISIRLK